jgi:hypothetical protein
MINAATRWWTAADACGTSSASTASAALRISISRGAQKHHHSENR